jgi:hypothetical protein
MVLVLLITPRLHGAEISELVLLPCATFVYGGPLFGASMLPCGYRGLGLDQTVVLVLVFRE